VGRGDYRRRATDGSRAIDGERMIDGERVTGTTGLPNNPLTKGQRECAHRSQGEYVLLAHPPLTITVGCFFGVERLLVARAACRTP